MSDNNSQENYYFYISLVQIGDTSTNYSGVFSVDKSINPVKVYQGLVDKITQVAFDKSKEVVEGEDAVEVYVSKFERVNY